MSNKILFVNGPTQDSCDRFFGWPTSLLYAIAPSISAIRNGNLSIDYVPKIFDPIWYVEGKNSEEVKKSFRETIEGEGVNVICVSASYDSLFPTLQLLREAKKINPEIKTVLGGPHFDETHLISLNGAQRPSDLIDFAVAGDGEYALMAVLNSIARGNLTNLNPNSIPGRAWIYYRGKQYATSGHPLDLDALPFMPIELVDVERHKYDFDVFSQDGKVLPTIQVIAQRGCPYHCNFCSERNELAYTNGRSIDSVLEEIELRKKQGFKAIFFDDSTFGAYKSKQGDLNELLRELGSTGMRFGSLNRFNHLTRRGQVRKYREAGFIYQYCSIEQFDNDSLEQMQKVQTEEQIKQSISFIDSEGIQLGVSLLYGLPYETDKSIKATLDFTKQGVDKGTIVLVSESVLSYHPGTPEGQGKDFEFNRTPPNLGHPYNRFEEGQWYHPKHVTKDYLERILGLSEERFSKAMVRNRHSWYSTQGLLLE
jgi:anaerobic magnesium-protoporphyrin IX monomethyl ester cyclase